jgi:hypothetical protein
MLYMHGILKGEVSLYHWPPVWLVWNQVYDNWQIFVFICNTDWSKPVKQEGNGTRILHPLVFPVYMCALICCILVYSIPATSCRTKELHAQAYYISKSNRQQHTCRPCPGKAYWRGRLSTVDLLELTSLDQVLFKMKIISTFFYKTS